jgi:myo-inositol-1(or 4)-monophosphatase
MNKTGLKHLLPRAIRVVEEAGMLLAAEWCRLDGPRGTGDKAAIDVEIEEFLRPALLRLLACDFWGEETGHLLSGHSWCWVVDPNDGTSDFLQGRKGSAISVGLLHRNIPVLGVVLAPVTSSGVPDCIAWAEGMNSIIRNGSAVSKLSGLNLTPDASVMVSAAANQKPEVNRELCAPASFVAMPSIAYRLARVAAGDGVCGISLYPVSAHDVVAGHALLRGVNGILVNESGEPITYETEASMANVSLRCFGGSAAACEQLVHRDWSRLVPSPKQ